MLDLGTTDFYIAVPSMPRPEFERYSTHLFDQWDAYVERTLALSDYSLALEVEEGSIKGVGRIAALVGAVYLGVGNYGSFISGLQIIRGQVNAVGDFLAEQAVTPFDSTVKPKVSKRGGDLSRLQRLFLKVQRAELTVEQAMTEAENILGDDAENSPEFMKKLEDSLHQTPRFHQQQMLPLDVVDFEDFTQLNEKKKAPQSPLKKPDLPPPLHYRVEVWRDSKKESRRVRVVQL